MIKPGWSQKPRYSRREWERLASVLWDYKPTLRGLLHKEDQVMALWGRYHREVLAAIEGQYRPCTAQLRLPI
jgi:hypothetical protein